MVDLNVLRMEPPLCNTKALDFLRETPHCMGAIAGFHARKRRIASGAARQAIQILGLQATKAEEHKKSRAVGN